MRRFSEIQHQDTIRYNNSKAVIRVLQDNKFEPISRADVAKILEMSPTSITRITASLIELGLIKQEEAFSRGVGRNGINICINKDAFLSLGYAIDCDYLKMSIIDCEYQVVAERICRLSGREHEIDELLQSGQTMLQEICTEENIDISHITCMGISICGTVDYQKGVSRFSPQLGYKNLDIKNRAEKLFGLPVCVDNDIKMALVGATFQSSELKNSDVTYISIGSGVGAGVMYDGKMIRGANNSAGEMGHIMFSLNGRLCSCGKNGCLSAYISESGVVRECNRLGYEITDFSEIMEAYHAGEEWAVSMIEDLTSNMAIAFCDIAYIYNSKYLLVGGNMIVDFPELYEMAKVKFYELINEKFDLDITIKKREFKNNEALGAAYTAQMKYIDKLLTT